MRDRSRFRSEGWPRWHALIEQYTPDGALGRLLLGLASGSASVCLLFLAMFGMVSLTLFSLLGGLVAAGFGVATGTLAVVTLWPVYLSLIGNVEVASAYGPTEASRSGTVATGPAESDVDDPAAMLKRRYAAGELSDEEFERRLDRLFDADERVHEESVADGSGRGRIIESDR